MLYSRRVLLVAFCLSVLAGGAITANPQSTFPVRLPQVTFPSAGLSSPCSDQCVCGCNDGEPCTCAAKSAKTVKTHIGKDGRLWTWSDEEGGHWWAYRISRPSVVIQPVSNHQGWYGHQQQMTYQIPQYHPAFHGSFSGASCVGGNCGQR